MLDIILFDVAIDMCGSDNKAVPSGTGSLVLSQAGNSHIRHNSKKAL
jgi:hypothetical protein